MWGFEGVEHEAEGGGVQFNGEVADLEATYLVGKIKAKAHPFVEYFKFLKQFEDKNTVAIYNSGTGTDISADDCATEY